MTGYDKSRIVDVSSTDLDEFTCCICCGIFNEPVVTQCCRQTYCKVCITEWLTSNQTCPNDRKPLQTNGLSPLPRFVVNLLINMKIKCEHDGCKTIVKIGELGEHIETCKLGPNAKCATCGLKKSNGDTHDCIAELIIRNKNISDELERLRSETIMVILLRFWIIQWTNEPFFKQGISATIETARNAFDNYVVECSQGVNEPMHQKLVEFCKESILEFDSYEEISKNLFDKLNNSTFYNQFLCKTNIWHAIAFNTKGGESLVNNEKYLRIRFGVLIIEVFTCKCGE